MNKILVLFYSISLFINAPICLNQDQIVHAASTTQTIAGNIEKQSAAKLGIDTTTKKLSVPNGAVQIDVAKKYGIKADGKTDNTYELLRLNQDCQGEGKPFYSFVFPKGEILYADNTWLHGIDSFEVVGNNTSFRCTAKSPWSVAKQFFYNGGLFSIDPKNLGRQGHPTGYRLKSATSGLSQVVTLDTQDVKTFNKGDRVFIAGYNEQMWGWPPNPRFFEWHTIKAVDKATSKIDLSAPLKFSYNEAWKDADGMFDDGQSFGKPRIYKINNYTRYARFYNCRFQKNKNLNKDETPSFFFVAENLICEDVIIDGYAWPSENRYARYSNCQIISAEPDKDCGVVEFIDCTFKGGLFGATGVDSLRLIRNSFGNYSPISPRILYAEGNSFNTKTIGASCIYGFMEFTHTDKVFLKNNKFSSSVKGDFVHVNYSDEHEFVTKEATASTLVLEDDNNPHSPLFRPIKNIGFGSSIKSKDGTVSGIVKDIVHDGKNWIIQLEKVKGKPKKNQIWTYRQTDKVYDLGGNKAIDGRKLWK